MVNNPHWTCTIISIRPFVKGCKDELTAAYSMEIWKRFRKWGGIGELCRLNRSDIDFEERECVVLGKGDKERITYFDARTKLHLIEYLKSRDDNNPALFVSIRKPAVRLESGGVEAMLRKLSMKCNVPKCHPHRFRRTCATAALSKGMPIEQVQKMLGHEEINTTLTYISITDSTVKNSHRKYMG